MSIQGISLHVERPNLSSDPVNQINTFRQYLNVLGDSQAKDENKLKAAQELNHSFDVIIAHPQYQTSNILGSCNASHPQAFAGNYSFVIFFWLTYNLVLRNN